MRKMSKRYGLQVFSKPLLVLLSSILLCFAENTHGQTQLISAANGGFESATITFAANGWTEVTPGIARQWRVNTAAGSVTGGTRSAYVGATANYNGTATASVQHFYRDVAIPADATNINLAFYLRETIVDAGPYDEFYVYTTTTANTPVLNTFPGAGYTLRFSNNATVYSAFTAIPSINLNDLVGTTVRIVFTFYSDGVAPHANPAIDNVTLSYTPAVTACTTPAANPAPVTVTPAGSTSLNVNFTPVTASGYLVVRTPTAAAPTNPVNGTVYTPGTAALGGYIESMSTATNINSTGLTAGTQYWYWVFAYNWACAGAPFYRTATPGNGTATTLISKNWVGIGAGGAGTDFNTAANWSPSGVPGPTHEANMNITVSGTHIVSFSAASTTVGTLNVTVTGNGRQFLLNAGSNSLIINGNTTGLISSGNTNTYLDFAVGNGGKITHRGNATFSAATNTILSILEGYNGGYVPTTGEIEFDGNLSIGANVYSYTSTTVSRVIFDGTGNQQINHSGNQYIILPDLLIGNVNNPTVTIGGTIVDGFTPNGNVSIRGTLNLPVANSTLSYCLNAFNPGNDLSIAAGGRLRLGGSTDGEGASNFPLDFGTFNFDPASTVEYYSTTDQQIFDIPFYGNLTCTNNSVKYINAYLIIDGNLLVNPTATFGCDEATYLAGNCVNNGIIEGIFTNSEFAFYGTGPQTYSGSGVFGTSALPFDSWGITVYNPTTLTMNAPVFTERINLFEGQVLNAGQVTIGSSAFGLIQRGGVAASNAGSLDTYPLLNGSPDLYLRYDDALSNISTGFEVPSTTNTYRTISDNLLGVTLNSGLTVTNDMQLVEGTFNIQGNTLTIANTITKTAGFINGLNGTLRMQGNTAQSIPANTFVNNDLRNLTIANTFGTTPQVTLAGSLNLYGSLGFGNVNAKTFNAANFLTLRSTATGTASIADLTNAGVNSNNRITGDVTVERFLNYVGNWNLLSAPVNNTQSVYNAWQNAGAAVAGYGTRITAPVAGPFPTAQGIDNYSAGYSLKSWNETGAGSWNNISNTTAANANNPRGYYLYARGDRSVIPPATGAATTLRSTGPVYMGYAGSGAEPTPVNYGALAAGRFASVGNPFASAINFANVYANSNTTRIKQTYNVWDPYPAGSYGVGRYQNYYFSGGTWLTTPTVNAGSPYAGLGNYSEIQSGQAVFVESNGGGTVQVSFDENDKISGSRLMTRDPEYPSSLVMMSTMIHTADGNVADGNRLIYDASFSNDFAGEDASKINNSGINFGIGSHERELLVEGRKPIVETDTIFYRMSGLANQQYRLSFEPLNLGGTGLIAELIDGFLNTRTPVTLTDSTWYNFEATSNPASKAANRFMLVFRSPGGPLPVTFVSITAQRQADRSIKVNWEVANEINIEKYEVQRSADGSNFTGILSNDATNSRQYTKNDGSPLADDNFYRIKAIGLAGDITYSNTVKVAPDKEAGFIRVQPNPVIGKQMNAHFSNQPPGEYLLQLNNMSGQVLLRRTVTVSSSSMVTSIALPPSTAAGNYRLHVYNKAGEPVHTETITIK